MDEIASIIGLALKNPENQEVLAEASKRVEALSGKYELYPSL